MDKAPNEGKDAGKWGREKCRTGVVATALILPLAAGAAWFLLHHSASSTKEKAKAQPKVNTVMHLDPFVVNLADPEGDRFLRVGIDLGLEREQEEPGQPSQAAMSVARTRDTILSILTTCDSEALVSPTGKANLKDQLAKALREHAPELGVREVYFTEFLVQR
jgi:flagellar FliL protein